MQKCHIKMVEEVHFTLSTLKKNFKLRLKKKKLKGAVGRGPL